MKNKTKKRWIEKVLYYRIKKKGGGEGRSLKSYQSFTAVYNIEGGEEEIWSIKKF